MKTLKKIALGVVAILVLFFLFAVWYTHEYSMDEVSVYEVNSEIQNKKILLAVQGSEFKNRITANITDYYKDQAIYMKVIDVGALRDVQVDDYNAIIMIHTWEYNEPPKSVTDFIKRAPRAVKKIVVLSTSGEGSHKLKGVDAIAGESILTDASTYSEAIISRVDSILEKKQ